MADQVIICPYCHREIPLTEAISHQIREQLRKEFDSEVKKKEQELFQKEQALSEKEKTLEEDFAQKIKIEKSKLEEEAKQNAEQKVAVELKDLKAQVTEKEQKLLEAQNAELELRKQRRELEERQRILELEMTRKLDDEREKIKEETSFSVSLPLNPRPLDPLNPILFPFSLVFPPCALRQQIWRLFQNPF